MVDPSTSTSAMVRAEQHVEQHFGGGKASNGGFLFQGYVNGPVNIHHTPRVKEHVPQRIIPLQRNEDVVDRGVFAELDQLLPVSPDYQTAALWGLSGSGKTQVALEYAYRRSRNPACSVFWVHADNETRFTHDYEIIAKRLGLADGLDGPELLMAVREWIEADPCWLLVLDNADNLAAFGVGQTRSGRGQAEGAKEKHSLYDFVPRGPGGTVLWTSCDKRIGGTLVGARRAIEVASMTEEEARILLERVLCREIAEEESRSAMTLLAELGRLPLAVSQAAAYIRRTTIPIDKYLSMLKERMKRWELLIETEFDRHRRTSVSNSFLQTWDISIEHIRQENQMAYDILHSLAFVDNQNILFELAVKVAEIMGRPTGNEEARNAKSVDGRDRDENQDDKDKVLAAVVLLQDFSILGLRTSGEQYQVFEMHKLVQEATQYSLSQGTRRTDESRFSGVALRAAISLFPECLRENWEQCERYLGHAQRAAEWARLCNGEVEAATLLVEVWCYLHDRGRWKEQEAAILSACDYRRKFLGEQHPDTISTMMCLAITYNRQGRYKEAEKILLEVLALPHNDIFGEEDPHKTLSTDLLAKTYFNQGKYKEGEKFALEALALRRKASDKKHPHTISSPESPATTCDNQERYKKAEEMLSELLALQRNILGEKHIDKILSLESLSSIYHQQGRYEEAEKIKLEEVELQRNILGEKHPDTILSMASLAATYNQQARYKEAEELVLKVLELQHVILGEKHPNTITSRALLATLYINQGWYKEAEEIRVEVFELRRDILGETHPSTISSKAALASVYLNQGRYEEAETNYTKVLELQRIILGTEHPETISTMAALATTYCNQKRYEKAEESLQEVLALQYNILGEKHPNTLQSLALLATVFYEQDRDEAEKLCSDVLEARRDVLGKKHPNTISSMASLALVHSSQGRYEEAEKLSLKVLALQREVLGEKHPFTLQTTHNLALTWDCLERRPEAFKMMQECFQLRCEVLGQTHASTQESLHFLDLWKAEADGKWSSRMGQMFGRMAYRFKARISQ